MKYSKLLALLSLVGTITSSSLLLTPEKSTAQTGPYRIVSRQYSKCLDADNNNGGRPGTRVQLWDCLPNARNQHWYTHSNGQIESRLYRGMCLDADNNNGGRPGTIVQLWFCNSSSNNQKWYWYAVSSGNYRFRNNLYRTRYLDADNNNGGINGTRIQLWSLISGARNQYWYFGTPL